jgi:hypothetical protein
MNVTECQLEGAFRSQPLNLVAKLIQLPAGQQESQAHHFSDDKSRRFWASVEGSGPANAPPQSNGAHEKQKNQETEQHAGFEFSN